MNAVTTATPTAGHAAGGGIERSPGLWSLAWKRLMADRVAVVSMVVVIAFLLMSLAALLGLIAKDWN
ncbi:MAG TPA: ABC transporter permease, partial [Candidatus Sumerlaeota bacterium]|nr:ABC transporter permease [Candidatus Sumerlaeota bacterium]